MKKWEFIECDDSISNSCTLENSDIPRFLSHLFTERKEYDYGLVERYFDVGKIKARIDLAEKRFEKVCIFGDYDVDGITSTIMFYSYLCERNIDVMYKLPSRYAEGYGLTFAIIDELKKYGVSLIITVDNGISAFDEIDYAKNLGIDVIVTDHHKIPERLPNTDMIINPHIDGFYDFQDFAGVGVVFKIIQSLEKENISSDELIQKYGDLLCLGTIGDVVPLVDENKILVKKSISMIQNSNRPGIIALLEGKVFGTELDGSEIAFGIIPILNACGRMGSPEIAVNLLLSETIDEARYFLSMASKMNTDRKIACSEIFEEVKDEILKKHLDNNHMICASSKKWSHGLIGVVSSSISSRFGKPCFLFSILDNEVRGSGRSIEGFDIYDCINSCSDLLEKYGGHPMAAGVSVKLENLDKFQERILSISNSFDMPFSCVQINGIISLNDVSVRTLDFIHKLSPFGNCNREPVFALMSVSLIRVYSIGSGRHIKIQFEKEGKIGSAVYFGISHSECLFRTGDIVDLAVRIKVNYFSGYKDAVLHIVDIRYSNFDYDKFISDNRIFEDFICGLKKFPLESIPNREDFVSIFKIFSKDKKKYYNFRIEKVCTEVSNLGIDLLKLRLVLEVFNELDIMNVKKCGDNYSISINNGKIAKLEESEILKKASQNLIDKDKT